ncbi:MAG: alpha/beta hydrolase [Fibrobacter sp.]|nr:alpha/beta hydrolase [Fibrobacter sp.]
MGKVMTLAMVASLSLVTTSFAQWGDFGGGGFGGFGGDQNGGGSAEYSEKIADVNYAGDGKEYHNLDIYIPKEAKDSYPVVIHTYGSAWSMNNSKGSADINTICAGFLKAGFAVVTPNHRSASDAIYPAALHDIKAVVRFVRGNAAKYKFDTNFVAVSGFSSGGHLSSLTATTCGMKEGKSGSVTVDLEGSLGEFTSFSSCVDAACLWSPPTDIYTMNPINSFGGSGTFEGAFIGAEREGNKDKWMVASSPYYASEEDPPIIMFHGTSDQVVNIEQSQELYDSLQKHNVVSEFVKVSGGTHGGNEMYVAANLDKAVEFFNKAIDAKKASAPAVDTTPAKTDSSEAKKDTVPAADTSAVETDTTKTDTSTTYIASAKAKSLEIVVVGNKLHVEGTVAAMKYKVVSVNGTFTETGDVLGTLDLSRLPSGVYCVIVTGAHGQHGIVRFVKK